MDEGRARRTFALIPLLGLVVVGVVLILMWSSIWTEEEGNSVYDTLAVLGILLILAGSVGSGFVWIMKR